MITVLNGPAAPFPFALPLDPGFEENCTRNHLPWYSSSFLRIALSAADFSENSTKQTPLKDSSSNLSMAIRSMEAPQSLNSWRISSSSQVYGSPLTKHVRACLAALCASQSSSAGSSIFAFFAGGSSASLAAVFGFLAGGSSDESLSLDAAAFFAGALALAFGASSLLSESLSAALALALAFGSAAALAFGWGAALEPSSLANPSIQVTLWPYDSRNFSRSLVRTVVVASLCSGCALTYSKPLMRASRHTFTASSLMFIAANGVTDPGFTPKCSSRSSAIRRPLAPTAPSMAFIGVLLSTQAVIR
mmetsp:Transcript_25702/g.56656  ORF Transcript_25702/g.56656 Transcript_25702/m.56656 type:complete len:305 (-) Transcript_25702:275-1189(-)